MTDLTPVLLTGGVSLVSAFIGASAALLGQMITQRANRSQARRSLEVAALDAESTRLREDFRALVEAAGSLHRSEGHAAGPVLAAAAVLRANPRANDEIRAQSHETTAFASKVLNGSAELGTYGDRFPIDVLEDEVAKVLHAIAEERRAVLNE